MFNRMLLAADAAQDLPEGNENRVFGQQIRENIQSHREWTVQVQRLTRRIQTIRCPADLQRLLTDIEQASSRARTHLALAYNVSNIIIEELNLELEG